MTEHDVQLLLDGAMLGEMTLLASWWVWGACDRRKDRRAAAERLATAEAAADRAQTLADRLDRAFVAPEDSRP